MARCIEKGRIIGQGGHEQDKISPSKTLGENAGIWKRNLRETRPFSKKKGVGTDRVRSGFSWSVEENGNSKRGRSRGWKERKKKKDEGKRNREKLN